MTTLTKPTARAASTALAFEHASDLAASADNADAYADNAYAYANDAYALGSS